jgi:hypothetical protein
MKKTASLVSVALELAVNNVRAALARAAPPGREIRRKASLFLQHAVVGGAR